MRTPIRLLAAIAAPVVVIGAAVAVPTIANAATDLPDKSASQVLALMAKAKDAGYSGTIEQKADLGLPALPDGAGASSGYGQGSGSAQGGYAGALEFLSGSHTVRVYADGSTKQRVQVLDRLAERDVVRNGSTVWTWDSEKNAATKLTLPSRASAAPSTGSTTPTELATRLVDHLKGSTSFAVDQDVRVAGRNAYQLTLTPKSTGTLVRHVVLAVDASTGVPLKVEVDAKGQKAAAFSVAFTKFDAGRPDAKLFDFRAPSGATVHEKDLSNAGSRPFAHSAPGSGGTAPDAANRPTVIGSGWDAVAVVPGVSASRLTSSSKDSGLLDQLTTPVAGGRAVQTSLLSVLLTDDGRVLVGAVPVTALQAAAG